jgi:hypothetical protein
MKKPPDAGENIGRKTRNRGLGAKGKGHASRFNEHSLPREVLHHEGQPATNTTKATRRNHVIRVGTDYVSLRD